MRRKEQVDLIGTSRVICDLKAELERVASSDAKVLITGESGSGKEVVAQAIHAASPRAAEAFVPVNCAGIPETLLESELFGHVRGSFTGAYRDKPGKLETADHGTILLDEIGEMTLRMQSLLLRYLETGEVQRVGAERLAMATNVRVIAATNKSLSEMIRKGQFREDLFYRLNVIHIIVPPLKDRREDIPLLIEHFLRSYTRPQINSHGGVNRNSPHSPVLAVSPEAVVAMTRYAWPGNVREVENVVERLVVTGRREVVQLSDLPPEFSTAAPTTSGVFSGNGDWEVADALFDKIIHEQQSFWRVVYPLYMNHEITRTHVRQLVHKRLEEARGNYKILLRLFNMTPSDYKRFLNFLRKHGCHLPFKQYRWREADPSAVEFQRRLR